MAADLRPGGAGPTDLEWGVARGIATFRWLAWAWAAAVLLVTRDDLGRPGAAVVLLGAAFVVSAATSEASVRRRPWLFHPAVVAGEVALGAGLLVADGWVYDDVHGQTFGSAWPIAGVLMAGVVRGPVVGALAGLVLGVGRWLGVQVGDLDDVASALGLWSTAVLSAVAGAAAGGVMGLVRSAEGAVARARAREEVARTLHDGVLQTLAVVQRRVDDRELAALAREQELDLRAFLAGDAPMAEGPAASADLAAALRRAASAVERRDGLRVEVLVVDDDHPPVAPAVIGALAGAVGEALTNAAKHGAATRATVFLDVGHEVFCSVKDDGSGFDPATVVEGMGSTTSMRGRIAEVGGTTEIDGRPGRGVEVRFRAPLRPPRRA
ncbi:MAG TPA: ATP-binding protein [Aquihabitans sp.]|nr:ATP-binding protein [Aquihabitans sp.]